MAAAACQYVIPWLPKSSQGLAPRAPCGAGRGLVRRHRLGLRRARADEEAHLSKHRANQQAHGSGVGGACYAVDIC